MILSIIHTLCRAIITIVLCGIVCSQAARSAEKIDAGLEVSNLSPTIGDSLTVTCRIHVSGEYRLGDPVFSDPGTFVEFIPGSTLRSTEPDGSVDVLFSFGAYVFKPDSLTIGPYSVDYVTAGGDSGRVISNPVTLVVRAVAAPAANGMPPEPKPNKPPVTIAGRGIPAWVIIVLAFLIAAAVWIYLRYRKYYPRTKSVVLPGPIDELGEFENIRAKRLYEAGKIKELYVEISDALRGFLYRNLHVDAEHETTFEIMSNLVKTDRDGITGDVHKILMEADMVKFARYIPPEGRSSTVIDRTLDPVQKVLSRIEREKALEAEKRCIAEESLSSPSETPPSHGGGVPR